MSDVFISYSRRDKEFVRRLFEALKNTQREAWVDWENIPYSVEWWKEIEAGIESAETLIFVVSPAALGSEICNKELAYAYKLNKRIIPIIRQEIDEKTLAGIWFNQEWEFVARENWDILKKINWLLFRRQKTCQAEFNEKNELVTAERDTPACDEDDFDPAFQALIHTIEEDIEHIRTHTRLLVRAREWEKNGQNPSFLLRGDDLNAAESWLSNALEKPQKPDKLHTEYIFASRAGERQRQRTVFTWVSVGLVIAFVLAIASFYFFQKSQDSLQLAEIRGTGEANQAFTSVANAVIAQDNAATSQLNAASATVAQGQAEINATLSANNAATSEANAGTSQANAASATVAQGQAEINATLAADNAATSQANALTATIAQGEAEINSTAAFIAAATSERQAEEALSLALASRAEQIYQIDASYALALAIEANKLPDPPIRAQEILARIAYEGRIQHHLEDIPDVLSLAVHPSGQYLAIGSYTPTEKIVIWDIENNERYLTFGEQSLSIFVDDIVFSPDGKWVVSAGDTDVLIWDMETGNLIKRLTGHTETVRALAFSPDGRYLVSGDGNSGYGGGTIIVWDITTATIVNRLEGQSHEILSIAYSPDGNFIASSAHSEGVTIWDATTGKALHRVGIISDNIGLASEIIFTADSQGLIVPYSDGLHFYDVKTGQEIRLLGENIANAIALAINPDGTYLAVEDGSNISVFDLQSGAMISQFGGHTDLVRDIVFTPDGQSVISAADGLTSGSEIFIWSLFEGSQIQQLAPDLSFISSVNFGESDESIIVTTRDQVVTLEVATGEILEAHSLPANEDDEISLIVRYPDDEWIAYGYENGEIVLAEAVSGREVKRFVGHSDTVSSIAFSTDGRYLLSGSWDRMLILWDIETGNLLRKYIGQGESVYAAAFSPDQRTIISGGGDADVVLWDIDTTNILRRFEEHTESVYSVAFSPDGQWITSGGQDQKVIVWDVNTGEVVRRFSGHTDSIRQVLFSPSGKNLLSLTYDGFIILWRMDTKDELIEWAYTHRFVPEITCLDRVAYNISPLCEVVASASTQSPISTASTSTTEPLILSTATPSVTPTALPLIYSSEPNSLLQELADAGFILAPQGFLFTKVPALHLGTLTAEPTLNNIHWMGEGYDNFVLSTTIQWGIGENNDACGIYFHWSDWDNFYIYNLSRWGNGSFEEFEAGAIVNIYELTSGIATHPNAETQVVLASYEGHFTVFINGIFASQFVDDSLDSGDIALFSSNSSNESDCFFKNSWIWNLDADSSPPAPILLNQPPSQVVATLVAQEIIEPRTGSLALQASDVQITAEGSDTSVEYFAGEYGDFILYAEVEWIPEGEALCHLSFRANISEEHIYILTIDEIGSLLMSSFMNGELLDLGLPKYLIPFGENVRNHLLLVVDGAVMTLYVNNTYVGQVEDTNLTQGSVNIIVSSNTDNAAVCTFHDLWVWQLD